MPDPLTTTTPPVTVGLATKLGVLVGALAAVLGPLATVLDGDQTPEALGALGVAGLAFYAVIKGRSDQAAANTHAAAAVIAAETQAAAVTPPQPVGVALESTGEGETVAVATRPIRAGSPVYADFRDAGSSSPVSRVEYTSPASPRPPGVEEDDGDAEIVAGGAAASVIEAGGGPDDEHDLHDRRDVPAEALR